MTDPIAEATITWMSMEPEPGSIYINTSLLAVCSLYRRAGNNAQMLEHSPDELHPHGNQQDPGMAAVAAVSLLHPSADVILVEVQAEGPGWGPLP
jgi:hypothetical protein